MANRSRLHLAEGVGLALAGLLGALGLVAAFAHDGIAIGGSSCGGGGAEQACRHVDRTLTVGLDLGWFSAALLALAIVLVVAAVVALLRPRLRFALSLVVLGIASAGLVGTEHVTSRFCPGEPGATCGRADDDWGPVLRPALLDFRADTRARLVGRPVRPGAPVAEAAQTLETFRADGLGGWRYLHRAAIVLWFVALALVLVPALPRAWLRVPAVLSVGLVSWAFVVERTHTCPEGASECYSGLPLAIAVVASAVLWALAFAILGIVRLARRLA
jgi:hypothetical protein